jgi:hypothetical protein
MQSVVNITLHRLVTLSQQIVPSRLQCLNSSDGKFPEIFTGGNFPYDVCASIFACLFFYRNIYVSGNFYHIIYIFYSIIYALGKFPESFRKFSSLLNSQLHTLRLL